MAEKIVIGLRIGQAIDDWYKKESERKGISKSELMRTALIEFLENRRSIEEEWARLGRFMEKLNKEG